MSSLICIGHSHVRAIVTGGEQLGVPIVGLDFWSVRPFDGEDRSGPLAEQIRRHFTGQPVFSVIGGNTHHTLGLVRHPRPFDFVLASDPMLPLDDTAEVLPYDGVREAMLEAVKPNFELLRALRLSTAGAVFHFEPPPVSADTERLMKDVPWMFFHGRREIAPKWLRYKLWRLHVEELRRFCEMQGITFVDGPREAIDADGFLEPAFYEDAMHVSPAYGALVVRQMQALACA